MQVCHLNLLGEDTFMGGNNSRKEKFPVYYDTHQDEHFIFASCATLLIGKNGAAPEEAEHLTSQVPRSVVVGTGGTRKDARIVWFKNLLQFWNACRPQDEKMNRKRLNLLKYLVQQEQQEDKEDVSSSSSMSIQPLRKRKDYSPSPPFPPEKEDKKEVVVVSSSSPIEQLFEEHARLLQEGYQNNLRRYVESLQTFQDNYKNQRSEELKRYQKQCDDHVEFQKKRKTFTITPVVSAAAPPANVNELLDMIRK
jgi:hypothetical protein